MDGRQAIRAQPEAAARLDGIQSPGTQCPGHDRRGKLFPERRRAPDADQKGPVAARHTLFQTNRQVTGHWLTADLKTGQAFRPRSAAMSMSAFAKGSLMAAA